MFVGVDFFLSKKLSQNCGDFSRRTFGLKFWWFIIRVRGFKDGKILKLSKMHEIIKPKQERKILLRECTAEKKIITEWKAKKDYIDDKKSE